MSRRQKSKQLKSNWLNRVLVQSSHHLALCLTEKQFHQKLKELQVPKSEYPPFLGSWHSHATTHFLENRHQKSAAAVVCLGDNSKYSYAEVASLICHEAVHVWQAIRETLGEKNPSSEFEAYSIQNITQTLLYEYDRLSGKQPKKSEK